MFNWILNKIAWDYNERQLKKLWPIVEKINEIDKSWDKLSDEDIKAKTFEFKERLKKWETLDDILPEAFAAVKQACKRLKWKKITVKWHELVWDMVPYDVQLLWWIVLHQWKIAEMKTWEGKTLVATLPAYLNALEGKGVHIVTVNDYLTERDAEWMGYLYNWLGLSVGAVSKNTPLEKRREEYEKDITYVENSELGFDYLRDNLAKSIEDRVLLRRPLNYAIIDEADSILIDEARTPLIISAPADEPTEKYQYYAKIVKALVPCKGKPKKAKNLLKKLLEEETEEEVKEECDYYIDEKTKSVTLTSRWIRKLEELLGVENLYKDLWYQEIHHIENALKALACYHRDKDYIVKDGEVLIVDEHTWRVMPWRRYSEWLHQAIEAKEGVEIQRESKTLATITYQHFFKQYKKLAWMTWTAATEWEEFEKIYWLEVIVIPTHKPVIRVDKPDQVFVNQQAKRKAVIDAVRFYHNIGVPLLIWTSSIQTSEYVSSLLRQMGISHYVLNAKYHEQEAEIVAKAWKLGSVVVATNMAWRWTDIKLEEWLLEKLAENYARWVKNVILWKDVLEGNKPKWVSIVVYSEKEFDLTLEGLKKQFEFDDEFIRRAEKDWECNDQICMKIKFNRKKKTKDEPFAEIIIKPKNIKEPEIVEKDFHYWLFVLGTEKHESRRIDNQLRGRSGRQGDPGVSVFYVSFDDELMRKMWWDKMQSMIYMMKSIMGWENVEQALRDKKMTSFIEKAQKQMEAWHYSIRKHLYDYDSVIDKQRKRVYSKRDDILTWKIDVLEEIRDFISLVVDKLVDTYTAIYPWRLDELVEAIAEITWNVVSKDELEKFSKAEDIKEYLKIYLTELYDKKISSLVEWLSEEEKEIILEKLKEILKNVYLNVLDRHWINHIDDMTYLRDKVGLWWFAQVDPLVMYKKEGYEKFQKFLFNVQKEMLARFFRTNFDFLRKDESMSNQVVIVDDKNWENEFINQLKEKVSDLNVSDVVFEPEIEKENNSVKEVVNDGDIEIIELTPDEPEKNIDDLINIDNLSQDKKVRPFDPCPCGSGKPYIKCCWKKKK